MPLGTESLSSGDAAWQLVTASWITHATRTMAELQLADHLASQPMTLDALAIVTDTHAPSLARLMRALVGLGFVARNEDGTLCLTSMGDYLRSDFPGSAAGFALGVMSSLMERPMLQLTEAIRTGHAIFPEIYGKNFWSYLSSHPADQARFDAAMTSGASSKSASILRTCSFEGITKLVDIGGGEGQILAAALNANPQLRGVLFDRPEALTRAADLLEKSGVANRCDLVSGDFFESVPSGGDAYLLSVIIHDWPDEQAVEILRSCYQAMKPGARIWIFEGVMDQSDDYNRVQLVDLLMLVLFAAKERTFEDHRALLEEAGFVDIVWLRDPADPTISAVEGIHP